MYGMTIFVSVNHAVKSAAEDVYVGQRDAGTGDALSSSLVCLREESALRLQDVPLLDEIGAL